MDAKEQVDALVDRISELLKRNHCSERELEDVVGKVNALPFQVRLAHKLGDLYLRAEKMEDAIATYVKVAEYYQRHQIWPKASAVCRQILKLNDDHWPTHEILADVLVHEEKWSEAIEEYRRLSRQYQLLGDLDQAAEFRQSILKLQPDNIVQYVKLAEILLEARRSQEAIVQFEQAIELLEERGYESDLLKVAERLLYVEPHHIKALLLTARLYLENNETMRALARLQQVFHLEPENPLVLNLLTIAFDKIEQPQKTLSVLHKLADVYRSHEQYRQAHDVYAEIVHRDPQDAASQASLTELAAVLETQDVDASAQPAVEANVEAISLQSSSKPSKMLDHFRSGEFPESMLQSLLSKQEELAALPAEFSTLPLPVRESLEHLFQRISALPWFQPQKNAVSRGIGFLQEFVRRISPFATAPFVPHIFTVKTSWLNLHQHLIPQEKLEAGIKEAVEKVLVENPHAWAVAGKAAWDAVYSFALPPHHLLSFDVANTAVSGAAWSISWNPIWVAARTAAWNASKVVAKTTGRTEAWKAAKALAWTLSWPRVKAAIPPYKKTAARTAAGDASWAAAWVVTSDHLRDQLNPFEPLVSLWELGLYPMLLFDGNYVLIEIDETLTDSDFTVIPVSSSDKT